MQKMMPLPVYSRPAIRGLPTSRKPRTLAQRRRRESVSLWLAMLMLLLVQPMFAEASDRGGRSEQGGGEFHFLDDGGRTPAPMLVLLGVSGVLVSCLAGAFHCRRGEV